MPLFNPQRSGFGTLAACLAVVLLLLIGSTNSSAQTQTTKIGVQFLDPQNALGNHPVNGSVAGAPGFTQRGWNGVSVEDSTNPTFTTWSRSGLPLTDDSGVASPITLSYFCQGSMPTHAIVSGQSTVTNHEKLVSNAIMTFNDAAFVKFSNVPGGVYVLVVYTANRHGNGSNGTVSQFGSYSVNGSLPVTLGNQYGKDFTTNGDTYKSHSGYPLTVDSAQGKVGDPENSSNYFVFSDIAPNSANEITLTFNAPSNDAAVNAVQLIKIIPIFTTQPRASTVTTVGSNVILSVVSPTATAFQWQKSTDGGTTFTNVPGATSATLTLTNVQTSDGGIYRVVATTPEGSYASSNAVLTVFTSNPIDPPVFVAFRTSQVASGSTPTRATTSTINAPGSGWSYSAAAQVAGTTWNQILRPNPLIGTGSANGTRGTFVCNSAHNIGLTSATGAATNLKLTMKVVIDDLDTENTTRVEPSAGSGGNTVLGPNGLMNNAWRIYRGGNSSTATVTGLTPNAHYLLYVYGSITTTGQGGAFTLNSDNVGSDDVATKSTTGGNSGNIFSTDGSAYSLTAPGTTWQQFHAVANSSGNLVITTARNSTSAQYYNGLQLVQYPLPVITAQPPASIQGTINGSVSIAVSATNGAGASGTLSYQWQKSTDGGATFNNIDPDVNVSAVAATLSFSNLQDGDAGIYRVLVTNSVSGGTVISSNVALTVGPSTNANLSNLALSNGTLSPVFDSATTSYAASVSNAISSLTVTPNVAEASATVKVNNMTVASGSASGAISLNAGENTITTVVTAQDGTTTRTYTVTVTRAPSSNADLTDLVFSGGALTPSFASATTSYTAAVSNTTTSITVTPTVAESHATVEVNNLTVASGSASGPIALNVGDNVISTVVTAQDGTTTKTFTLTVNRAPSSNADLANLVPSAGTLSPSFASPTTSYTATVSHATTSITMTPAVAEPNAAVKVNNATVASGSASGAIALAEGDNVIITVVTAQDGATTKTYTVTVTRKAPEIVVEQPVGNSLADAASSVDFGLVGAGSSSAPLTFTITNPGSAELSGLAVSAGTTEFTVGPLSSTTVAPGGEATFTVTFTPSICGVRSAALQIASNVQGDKNPYDIALTGTGTPVAIAGADFNANEEQVVSLDGSASTPNDGSLTFSWVQVPGGTAVSLTGADSAVPSFIAPTVALGGETLSFDLTVTSNGQISTDTVSVTIVNVNHPPVADAGPDQSVAEGSPVTLQGENSFDIDFDPFTYAWVQVGGTPVVNLSGANTSMPTFTAPIVGSSGAPGIVATLVFELLVDDGFAPDAPAPGFDFANVRDRVTIEITNTNNTPVANAGADQTVDENTAVVLDGSNSSDPDSDPLTYAWTQVGGPAVTLSGAATASPSFAAPFVTSGGADLTFQLTVNDRYDTATDSVVIHVQNEGDPPLASAAQPTVATLWPPSHQMVAVGITGVSDPDNNTTITITSITQDEPTHGLGDGDTAIDAVIDGDAALLRSERSSDGDGRVYRIYFTASDLEGSASGMVKVSVPLSVKKTAVDSSGVIYNSTY